MPAWTSLQAAIASLRLSVCVPLECLANAVGLSVGRLDEGRVFPKVESIRDVSREVAVAVAHHAYDKKIARTQPGRGETVEGFIERKMYYPEYVPLYSQLYA